MTLGTTKTTLRLVGGVAGAVALGGGTAWHRLLKSVRRRS